MTHLIIQNLKVARSANFALGIPNLELRRGRILGVVGPNGSGKTTFIEALAGVIEPSEGAILIGGKKVDQNLAASRAHLGYIPDDEEWYVRELTADEYFALLASIYKRAGITTDCIANARRLAKKLQFSAFRQRLDTLSHGNKKKVEIIAGLMHKPRFIIVDELRNGLDPLAIIAAEALIRAEAQRGATIVTATHDLWWAERIADETLLILNGTVAIHDKTNHLVKKFGSLEQMFLKAAAS